MISTRIGLFLNVPNLVKEQSKGQVTKYKKNTSNFCDPEIQIPLFGILFSILNVEITYQNNSEHCEYIFYYIWKGYNTPNWNYVLSGFRYSL